MPLLLNSMPDDVEIERDGDGYVVTVPAIEDPVRMRYLTLDCRLDPLPDHGDDSFEFSFGFVVNGFDSSEPTHFTQDRYEVKRYFGEHSREFVLPTVCVCIEALVDHVQPTYIFRVTKSRNLPQSALEKHNLVTDTLVGLGFQTVDSGTDGFDRLFWFMSR